MYPDPHDQRSSDDPAIWHDSDLLTISKLIRPRQLIQETAKQ